MVSEFQRTGGVTETTLRCRQVVAVESGGQCFQIVVVYDWGATMSMVTREAISTLGLTPSKQAKKVITGLGDVTVLSKSTCSIPLVARDGDQRVVTAWEDVDKHFLGLRYLTEPSCLAQREGPVHLLIGMDHAHLMPEHAAERTKFSSQVRLMKSTSGNQYILVAEGAPHLSWCDAMEADERDKAVTCLRR